MAFDLSFLNTEWGSTLLIMFVILYGLNLGRIQLPDYIRNLFNNTIFRIAFLSLFLVHNFNKAPHVGLAVALVFVLVLEYLGNMEAKENFVHLESFRHQI